MTQRNLLVGCVMAMVAKKPPASTPYLAQRLDEALSLTINNRVLYQALDEA